jgi:hypothetical protein
MAGLKVLSQHLLGETGANCKRPLGRKAGLWVCTPNLPSQQHLL